MATRKTHLRPSLKSILFFGLILIISGGIIYQFLTRAKNRSIKDPTTAPISEQTFQESTESTPPQLIDFQPTVNAWVATTPGQKSVIIYDLDNDQLVTSINPHASYNTASLYKLFVIYEAYRRVEQGSWSKTDPIANHTIEQCLDLAIRESHSPCAEALWAKLGHTTLDQIIASDLNIHNSKISGFISNPEDIAKIMRLYYDHPDFSPTTWATIQDSMLNQPCTSHGLPSGCYNWRQGLPAGFSQQAKVYNKVGWDWNGKSWNLYHDSAIIEFPAQSRHFIVVVMTKQVSHRKIAELGQKIEATFNAHYSTK